jgi:hypothetical protein
VLATAAVAAVVLVIVLVATGGGGGGTSTPPANRVGAQTTTTPRRSSTTSGPSAPARASTVVTVLNGTGVTGLARQVMNRITRLGYHQGAVTNATSSQQRSTVAYASGYRAAARQVASLIGVSAAPVRLDATTIAAAGDPPPDVVVVVGADKAQ